MKALRTFHVETEIPTPLAGLRQLAYNLRWSWHEPTRELFRSLHPGKYEAVGGNPAALLEALSQQEWRGLAADDELVAKVTEATRELAHYVDSTSWFDQSQSSRDGLRAIAYFSAEYGITEILPQYSGGLGVLAGDHLKSASDLGVPLVAVGLFYKSGYFHQSLDREGKQVETYPVLDVSSLPVGLLEENGRPVVIELPLPDGRTLRAQVRTTTVGRVTQLLLDTDVDGNDEDLRALTFKLYGGGGEERLRQELLLGMGGVKALRAHSRITGSPEPQVYHCNEGHAGFLSVERLRELVAEGVDLDTAVCAVRAGNLFTTHTPVPAGIDRFPVQLVRDYFSGAASIPGIPVERILEFGAENFDGGDPGVFNMAVMGLRLAQRANGVSQLHGQVSRSMFGALWPAFDADEVPITSITNGIHRPTWLSPRAKQFASADGSASEDADSFSGIAALEDEQVWRIKRSMRADLVADVRQRVAKSGQERGFTTTELAWTEQLLDPEVLTIGFARRVPTYKRLTLMLRDPERLKRLLTDPERPVQLVVAGKAHPHDEQGKELIRQLVRFADEADVRHRIAFLPNYDLEMARTLYPGCDVWLNNPLRPFEASGTSGMKAAINGALNLSILDGWWDEWYTPSSDVGPGNGWAIPTADGVEDPERRDDLEAAAFYDLLEREVAPTFYDRDATDTPTRWVAMMRQAITELGPKVMATRMVSEYTETLYRPAAISWEAHRENGFALARRQAEQEKQVRAAFPHVHVDAVEAGTGPLRPGATVLVEAYVSLAGLAPELVRCEALTGSVDGARNMTSPRAEILAGVDHLEGDRFVFRGRVTFADAGEQGLAVRILPNVEGISGPAELGLAVLAG